MIKKLMEERFLTIQKERQLLKIDDKLSYKY